MKKTNVILLAVVAVIVLVCFGACGAYNGMVDKQEAATTALADVQATYQRRADLIPNLAKTVQAYAKHEKETFEALTKARASVGQVKLDASNLTPEKLKQFEAAQGEMSNALGKLMLVAEQLEGTENRINEARQQYNAAVQAYNQSVRRFPNAIFVGMFGFDKMEKFEAAAGSEKAPALNFDE